jgi:VWFA-related protein
MRLHYLLATVLIVELAAGSPARQSNSPGAAKPATPQQPTRPRPPQSPDEDVVRITTNLVQVDAVVVDKNGKPVTDLKPEEVEILEDKHPQKITNFSYIIADARPEAARAGKPVPVDKNAPPPPPVITRPDQVRRTIAIVVDDLGLSFGSIYYVRRALQKFVDEQMQPGDLVAIIRTGGGIGALQQFTSDKQRLNAAIARVRWNSAGRSGTSAFPFMQDNLYSTASQGADAQAMNDNGDQFQADTFTVGTLGAIGYVVNGMRELPGRKSVLLVSDGFKITNRDDSGATHRTRQALQRLIDQASRASVVIYAMNATGLQTFSLAAADAVPPNPNFGQFQQQIQQHEKDLRTAAFDQEEGPGYLAQQTGGIFIHNTNDLGAGIRRVMDDQRGYYLIGFRPDDSTFDPKTGRHTFHSLTLKVLRPGKFDVRTRLGFLGFTSEDAAPQPHTARAQVLNALTSPFGASGVHVQLTSLFANDANVGSYMRSMIHINGSDLTFTDQPDGWHQAIFDVVAVTFGDNGKVVDQISRKHTVRLKGDGYQQAIKDGFVYYLTVPIKTPGAYQLRVALRDQDSERVGSASQFVEVPDTKKNVLELSGLTVMGITRAEFDSLQKTAAAAKAGASVQPTGTAAPPVASTPPRASQSDDSTDETDPQASPAVRHLRPGMVLEYGFAIYNARLDQTTSKPQLTAQMRLFLDGKPIFTGKESPVNAAGQPDLKRLTDGGVIQLPTDMTPGEYVLQVVVTDALADQKHRTTTQWMDFEIVK